MVIEMLSLQEKFPVRFVALGLMLCALFLTTSAAAHADHWYCVHAKDHQRPRADAALDYVRKYDGYYLGEDAEDKVIYLTFDAGYENGNVEKILDVLREQQVPAAFFILSNLINRNPELVERMFSEGHTVCNHTAHHKDMSRVTDRAQFAAELDALSELCREKLGHEVAKYYRPPEGNFSEENMKWAQELGYKTIFWSFAYADWDNKKQPDTSAAKEKILSNLHPGEIMLLHPTSATNAAILGEVIRTCKEQGYRFGTLEELTAGVTREDEETSEK